MAKSPNKHSILLSEGFLDLSEAMQLYIFFLSKPRLVRTPSIVYKKKTFQVRVIIAGVKLSMIDEQTGELEPREVYKCFKLLVNFQYNNS